MLEESAAGVELSAAGVEVSVVDEEPPEDASDDEVSVAGVVEEASLLYVAVCVSESAAKTIGLV